MTDEAFLKMPLDIEASVIAGTLVARLDLRILLIKKDVISVKHRDRISRGTSAESLSNLWMRILPSEVSNA